MDPGIQIATTCSVPQTGWVSSRNGNVSRKVIEYPDRGPPPRAKTYQRSVLSEENRAHMNEYKLYIDDQWGASSKGIIEDDMNPANGTVYARIHQATREDLDKALAVAHRRFAEWKHSPPAQREKILCTAADILESRTQEF